MKRTMAVAVVVWVALAACGGSDGSSGPASAAEVRDFSASARAISSAATAHGTTAAAMTDRDACTSEESAYDARVRPILDHMASRSEAMDEQMSSMGRSADADMTCATDALRAELDLHASIACASRTDMGPNRTEAARHVQAMTEWAEHQRVRSEELGSMMGVGGMSGSGATGTCRRNADGSYTRTGP